MPDMISYSGILDFYIEMENMARQLRKVEALSDEREHVYECASCVWIARVSSDRRSDEIEMEFDEHDCKDHPLSHRAARAGHCS